MDDCVTGAAIDTSDDGVGVVAEEDVAIVFDVTAMGVLAPSSAANDGNTTLENVIVTIENANESAINVERMPTPPSFTKCSRLSRSSRR